MDKIRLGQTDLMVTKTAFGALPIQRVDQQTAVSILRSAYDLGINFFDTAHGYTDSEEKMGVAFKGMRDKIIIATKTPSADKAGATADIEDSLRRMQTDYIDVLQFHNPEILPDPNDPNGAYAAALEAKQKGYVRHIGITNHRASVATAAVESGNFATMQFPFSYLASEMDFKLVEDCAKADIGFIAMKGLSGGMLGNARACYTFMQQFPTVVPIWGIQRQSELEEWIALTAENPAMDDEMRAIIAADQQDLAGNFCRGCGYCLPCPADIDIKNAARMAQLLRRAPIAGQMTDEINRQMENIDQCIHCNACKSRCPYGLDIPNLLATMLVDYREMRAKYLANTL